MNEGRITILFNNAEMQNVTIETHRALTDTQTWVTLTAWWVQSSGTYGYDTLNLPLGDGGALLLKRSEITSIGLTPKHVYEINTKL